MNLNSADARCRYIPAPGTQTRGFSSPFGSLLSKVGLELPPGLPLELMVARGWVTPMIRVSLPRAAFDAWTNFPVISPLEADTCPDECSWAIDLYVTAMSGGGHHPGEAWWLHEFDDDTELARAARAHAIGTAPSELPTIFHHARYNQLVRPWLDYFAYWQAFQIADYARFMTATYSLTDEVTNDIERVRLSRTQHTERVHTWLSRKWRNRLRAFDWLSRMRTVLACSVTPGRTLEEITLALRAVGQSLDLSVERMRGDVRTTLLQMWSELTATHSGRQRAPEPLLHLLRQEIEYAVFYVEQVGGTRLDPLDEFWSPKGNPDGAAKLIDALPHEGDLARRDFPRDAEVYLRRYREQLPALSGLDQARLSKLISANWDRSRALRRFVLAFRRLHEQLRGEQLTAEEAIVRQAERIEQFLLVVMHAERVLSHETRERTGGKRYPDVRALCKDVLNHVLGKWGLLKGGFSSTAQGIAKALLDARAQLHDLGENAELPLITCDEVESGNSIADHLIAAFVNLVITRNYAAHHDALDFDLVYPSDRPGTKHPGGLALESALVAVLATLMTR